LKKTLGAFRRPFKLAAAFKPRGIGQKTFCTVGNASAGKRVAREREGKNGAGRNREQARELEAGPTNRPHDSRGGATSRASASLASRGAPVAPPPPASPAAAPPASRCFSLQGPSRPRLLLLPAGARRASASLGTHRLPVRLPVGDPSASLQGTRRLPVAAPRLLPAGAPSPQGQCPPLLAAPSSRSLLRPLLLSPVPLPCSG